jgi:hypothetical protein
MQVLAGRHSLSSPFPLPLSLSLSLSTSTIINSPKDLSAYCSFTFRSEATEQNIIFEVFGREPPTKKQPNAVIN